MTLKLDTYREKHLIFGNKGVEGFTTVSQS